MDLYSESKRYNDLMQNYKNILNRMKYLLSFTEISEDISCRKLKSQEELNLITNELLELKGLYLSENSSNSLENKIDETKNTTELQNTTQLNQINTKVTNKNIVECEDINTELKKLDEIIKPNNETRQKSKYSLLRKYSKIMVKPKDKKLKRQRNWEPDMLPYNASFMSLALSRNELPEVESKVVDLCESNSQTHHEKYHILKSVFLREKVKYLNIENYSTCFSPICWTRNLNCHKINSPLNSSLRKLSSKRPQSNLKYLQKHFPIGLGPTNFITMPVNVYHSKKSQEYDYRNSKKTYKDVSCNTNKIKYRQICKRRESDQSDSAFPYKTSNESLPFEVLEYKVQKLPKPKPTKQNKKRIGSSVIQYTKRCDNKYIYEPSISSLPPDDEVIVSGCKKKRNKKHLKNEYITYLADTNRNLDKENENEDTDDDDDDSDSAGESSGTNSEDSTTNFTKTNSSKQSEKGCKPNCESEVAKYLNRTLSTDEQLCARQNYKCVPNRNLQAAIQQPDYKCQNLRDSGRNADELRNSKECRTEVKEQDSEMTYNDEYTPNNDRSDGERTPNNDSSSSEDSDSEKIEEVKKQERKAKHQTTQSAYPCTEKGKCRPHLMVPLTPESDMSVIRTKIWCDGGSKNCFESSSIMAPIPETPESDSCKSVNCKRRKQCKKFAKPSLIVPLTPSYASTPESISEKSEDEFVDTSSSLIAPLSITPDCASCDDERSLRRSSTKLKKRPKKFYRRIDKSTKTRRPPTPSEDLSSSDDSSETLCYNDKCSECDIKSIPSIRKHISTNTKPLPVIHDTSTNTCGTECKTDNMHAWALAYVKFQEDGAKLVQILHTTRQAPGRYLLKEPNELFLFGPQAKNSK